MTPKDTNTKAHILNFNSARKEQIEERRRAYERVLFRSVLGVYTVMEQQRGLHAIELLDISEGGMSFQLPLNSDLQPQVGDVINLRLYFSPDSFLPISVKVVRKMDGISDGAPVHQFGCEIDRSFKSYSAVNYLFKFISACAEHGHLDNEHLKIFY